MSALNDESGEAVEDLDDYSEFIIEAAKQIGIVAGPPRISMHVAVASAATASGLHLVPPGSDAINRDGRQNKKSKWDKVDGDRKNPLPTGVQDVVSTVGSHAAILSANAGSGYMLFAQQKRREAEEKRSSDRRLERRS